MSCIPERLQLLESHNGLSRLRPAHPCQQPTCWSSVSPAKSSRKLQSATVWLMWHSWQVRFSNICLINISVAVLHLSSTKISTFYIHGFYFIHDTLETWTCQSCSLSLKPRSCWLSWTIGRALIRTGGSSFVVSFRFVAS